MFAVSPVPRRPGGKGPPLQALIVDGAQGLVVAESAVGRRASVRVRSLTFRPTRNHRT